jgi:glycosyltransferase involved in cell wall biosynthesis
LLFVHDAMIWESPDLFDPGFAAYARLLVPYSVRHADRVLTTTAHTRDLLMRLVPSAKVSVVALPGRRVVPTATSWTPGLKTVLMVGETGTHKNHIGGIEAVRRLRDRTGSDIRLLLIGPAGRAEGEVQRALSRADPMRAWTQRQVGLTDDQVDRAYEHAWVLLQPSLNEGYGVPLVEAAQRGLPVVHAGAGGMLEVLPGSSVGSTDPEAFTRRLECLLLEAAWRESSAEILGEAHRFSWDRFRVSVANVVQELCPESHHEAP